MFAFENRIQLQRLLPQDDDLLCNCNESDRCACPADSQPGLIGNETNLNYSESRRARRSEPDGADCGSDFDIVTWKLSRHTYVLVFLLRPSLSRAEHIRSSRNLFPLESSEKAILPAVHSGARLLICNAKGDNGLLVTY